MSLAKKINLKDDEEIVMIVRSYALVHLWKYAIGAIFLLVSSFFMFRLFFFGWWGDVVFAIGMAIGFYMIVRTWFMSRKNMLVITSARAIDIYRSGWFEEIISEVSFLDIKEVTIRKKGIWQSLFSLGDIDIGSRSEQLVLEAKNVYSPAQVQSVISDLCQLHKQDLKITNTRAIYSSFINILPTLPDGDLQHIKKLINEQLGPNLSKENEA